VQIPLRSTTGQPPPSLSDTHILWAFGFRPFYLLASLFAATSILLWVAQFSGFLPSAYLAGPQWHGHEMLFGFATAVLAGFLLTAVATWTQQPPLHGARLISLVILWLAGRVLVLSPFPVAAAVANALFPLALAGAIAMPLVRTRNHRNLVFVMLLALLGVLSITLHLSAQGLLRIPVRASLQMGLDMVLLVIVVVSGRVAPMFTNNGVPGAGATRHRALEFAAPATVVLLFVSDLMQWNGLPLAVLAIAAALVHGARLFLWRPWRTLRTPLVWILHAAYGWIVVHLALRGIAALGWLAPTLATHALTVGAIGGMTIGMMTRTARGHTGRPLQAGRAETAMFVLIQLAALVRVLGGVLTPAHYLGAVQVSGLLWSTAFALYASRYWNVLTRPRLDGRPG
jgi:uncharacterized protein involved in response to NO